MSLKKNTVSSNDMLPFGGYVDRHEMFKRWLNPSTMVRLMLLYEDEQSGFDVTYASKKPNDGTAF